MASLARIWREDDGVLSFEWTLLLTLLVIGTVCGVAGVRDGIVDELGDTAQALLALDNSFTIDFPLTFVIDGVDVGGASDSGFTDVAVYIDCGRTAFAGQPELIDP